MGEDRWKNLEVWQLADKLALDIFKATKSFPKEEMYGLTSQLRRACSSIAANIAEGCGAGTNPEFGRYLQIAMGSAAETEYHIFLAHDLKYVDAKTYELLSNKIIEVRKMLNVLIQRVKEKTND